MNALQHFFHTVNVYRLHIVCAFTLLAYLFTFPYVRDPWGLPFLSSLLAMASLWAAFYIGNKYFDYAEDSVSQPTEARSNRYVRNLTIALYTLPVPVFLLLEFSLWYYLLLVVGTLLYSLPLPGTTVRMKTILGVKNLYAAFMWWLGVATFVYFHTSLLTFSQALANTFDVFLFLLVIELLWDIRDVAGDKAAGNITVPVYCGVLVTKLCIIAVVLVTWYSKAFTLNPLILTNLVYLGAVAAWARPGFSAYYFHAVVYVEVGYMLTQIILLSNQYSL